VPKFGKERKTEAHLIKLGAHVRNVGNCLNIHEAETACGLKYQTEVDSSD
jgi:hypothetical protein